MSHLAELPMLTSDMIQVCQSFWHHPLWGEFRGVLAAHTHRTCSLMHTYTSQTCDQHVQTGGHAQTTWKDHVTQSNRHTHTHSCITRPYSNNCTLGTKQSVYTVECMGGIELGHMPIEEVYPITKAAARICPEVSAAHTTLYCIVQCPRTTTHCRILLTQSGGTKQLGLVVHTWRTAGVWVVSPCNTQTR